MRETIKLAVRLMVFALVSALMLAAVNMLTKDRIADNQRAGVNSARIAVLGDYDFEELTLDLTGYEYVKGVYAAYDNGTAAGYVYELQSQGFAGIVSLVLGVDPAGNIVGLNVASHTETKGLGTADEGPFLQSFVGLSATGAAQAPATEPTADANTGAPATEATATPATDAVTGATTDASTGATATEAAAAEATATPATDADTGATTDASTGATATEATAAPATDTDTGATTDANTGATGGTELSGDVADSAVADVDGMTGATYSSNAVKNAVAEALKHFAANFPGGEGGAQ